MCRRFAFCGTFPRVAPAGRYPAPLIRGARTFLPADLSILGAAAVQSSGRALDERSRLRLQQRSQQRACFFICHPITILRTEAALEGAQGLI